MRDIPLSVIITWPIPNYVDPVTQGYGALIVNVLFMAITIPMVALRVYSRWSMRRWLGLDDFFCILAVIFAMGLSIATIIANYVYGCDRHIYDIPPANLTAVLKIIMATKALFTCASTFIRQSLLCLYLRLISDSGMAKFKWAIHTATVVNISIGIAFICLTIFQCTPVWAYWMFNSDAYGKCLDEGVVTLVCGVIITIVDFMVLLLPIPIVMKLQMSFRRKIGVIALLNLGLIASIMAIVRTWYIWKATISSYDESWYAYPLWMIAVIEIDLAIMASCAPAIRPLLAQHAPWLLTPFRAVGSAFSTARHIITGRRASGYFPNSGRSYNNTKNSDPSNTQVSSEEEQPVVVPEKQTYHQATEMELGESHVHAKEVAVGSSQNRTHSVAPSEAPTLHPRPKSPQKGIGKIKGLFSRSRPRRSESATRPYIERDMYSYDDSIKDRYSPDIRARLGKSKAGHYEMRAKSMEGLQVYKHQSYEIDSAPMMSPEEMTALQHSLAGVSVNAPSHSAVVHQSRPLVSRHRSGLSFGHGRSSSGTSSGTSNPVRHSHKAMPALPQERPAPTSNPYTAEDETPRERQGRTPSMWDIKRKEWEAHGRRWPGPTEQSPYRQPTSSRQQRPGPRQTQEEAIVPDHIVYQSRLVSAEEPLPAEAAPAIAQPAQVRRVRDQASPHTLTSDMGSFLDDASEESIKHVSRQDARFEGRGRRRSRGI